MSEKGQPAEIVAQFCNITVRRVQQLAKEGVFPRVGRGRYPLLKCVHAYIEYWQKRAEKAALDYGTLEEARTRKMQAEARLAELELARAEGEVTTRAEFEAVLSMVCDRLRAKVLNMPGKWAPMTVGKRTMAESLTVWQDAATELLTSLSATGDELEAEAGPEPGDDADVAA